MTQQEEEKLFARKASGLVKEASGLKALMFNFVDTMGGKFFWSVSMFGLFPAALIFGFPTLLWFFLLIIAIDVVIGIVYVQVVTPMPRSGADYVVPGRIMGPFWGWINSWMIVFSWIPLWGYVGWMTLQNITLVGTMLNLAGVVGNVSWILTSPADWIFGTLAIVLAMAFCLIPPKKLYTLMLSIGLVAVLGFAAVFVSAAVAGTSHFSANLLSLTGNSTSDVVNGAASNGFNINASLGFYGLAGLLGYVLFAGGGGWYSASITGELRGNVKRALSISIFGGIALYFVYQILFVWGLAKVIGYDLVASWSYLYFNTNSAPLNVPLINGLAGQIAMPGLWPIWIFFALAGLVATWCIVPASMIYINRQVLYWGMDRSLPKSVTTVWRGVPIKVFIAEGVVAFAFYAFTLLGVSPLSYPWWSNLLSLTYFFFPAFCGIIIVMKRKDIMAAVPWKKALLPLSLVTIILMAPIYLIGCYGGTTGLSPGQTLWGWAIETGLILTAVVIVVGVVVYYAVRSYNLKRGIELDKIYKEIPPD